jgi:hypothetical protein
MPINWETPATAYLLSGLIDYCTSKERNRKNNK